MDVMYLSLEARVKSRAEEFWKQSNDIDVIE
jgi:hypothetical protein